MSINYSLTENVTSLKTWSAAVYSDQKKKKIVITAFFHVLNVKLAQYPNTLHYHLSC